MNEYILFMAQVSLALLITVLPLAIIAGIYGAIMVILEDWKKG